MKRFKVKKLDVNVNSPTARKEYTYKIAKKAVTHNLYICSAATTL